MATRRRAGGEQEDLDEDTTTLEEALGLGDIVLRMRDGREITAIRSMLVLASPIMRDALSCRPGQMHVVPKDSQGHNSSGGLPYISVEGDFEGWTELLKFLYHAALTGRASELTPHSARIVFPIAHTYNMKGLMRSCVEVVQQSKLPLGPLGPQPPLTPEEQARQQPSLFQWLALGDAKQYKPLVHACLYQLSKQEALPVVRSALAGQASRAQLDGLCSVTLMEVLNVVTGLPCDFKGVRVPDLSQDQPCFKAVISEPEDLQYRGGQGAMFGSLLLLPRTDTPSVEVLDTRDGSSFQLQGHSSVINTVAVSSSAEDQAQAAAAGATEGQLALSCSADCSVRLWDLGSRQCRLTFDEHRCPVWSVCFCGQHQAASGSRQGFIKVWDLATGEAVFPDLRLQGDGNEDGVNSLKASSDGRYLLSASEDQCLRLWDLRKGRCVRTLTGHAADISTVCMDAQGRVAVSGSDDMTLRTWDLGSGRCIATLMGHEDMVHTVRMDSASTTALSLSNDNTICVWDLSRNLLTASHVWPDTALGQGSELWHLCATRDLERVGVVSQQSDGGPFVIHVFGS